MLLLLWATRLRGQGGEIIVFGRSSIVVNFPAAPLLFNKERKCSSSFFFYVTVFFSFSLRPSLMSVMWMLNASCLLVCDACCGLSVGTFKAAAPAAVEPQNKASDIKWLGRLVGHQRRLLLIGGKFVAHGVCMSEAGEVVQHLPVLPLLLWCHRWGKAGSNLIIPLLCFPRLIDNVL